MALGYKRGQVPEAQLRRSFRSAGVFFTAIALLTTFFAWGEIDKAYFGQTYDAQIVEKYESGSRRTSYHIRYSYVENGVSRTSSDNVDLLKYDRFAGPTKATSAPTGKVKVGKALGFYFDEYFEGEFKPEPWVVRAISVVAVLANLLAVYFWVRPLFGQLSDPVEAQEKQFEGTSQSAAAINPAPERNPNLLVALVRARGPVLNIVFVLGLLLFSLLPAILILSTLMTLDAVYWGKTYEATIVRKYTYESRSRSESKTKYYIEYSYEAGGQPRGGERAVSSAQYDRITVPAKSMDGQALSVRVSERLGRHWKEMILPGETIGERVGKDVLYTGIGCAIFLIPDAILVYLWRYLRGVKQRVETQSKELAEAV